MNTKKIFNGSTPKGGKDNTRVVLTATGAAAVGAVAGSALTDKNEDEGDIETIEEKQDKDPQEEQLPPKEEDDASVKQESADDTQPSPIATDNNNGGASNTGTTNGGNNNTIGTNNNNDNTGNTVTDDVDAEALAVAERLVDTNEIDPNDIDAVANVHFEGTGTIYTDDGSEIPASIVTTPDGGEYLLADLDGDKVYDIVYDRFGNPVSGVQAGLNTSDAELALNEENGYIAPKDDDPKFDDDPNQDIIALDSSVQPDDNMVEIEEDDILAEIFEEGNEAGDDTSSDTGLADGLAIGSDSDIEEDLVET